MKKLVGLFIVIAAIILSSCVGEQGPPGQDGVSFLGNIFEIQGDFTSQNDYELYYDFPDDFEIYETDIVMVYILWDQITGNNGESVDIWRPLPQTIVLNEGTLQYNFDYTVSDVRIFLAGDIDFSTLLPAEKDNQVFRIAVFPADYATNNMVDVNDLNSVMNFLDFSPDNVQKVNL